MGVPISDAETLESAANEAARKAYRSKESKVLVLHPEWTRTVVQEARRQWCSQVESIRMDRQDLAIPISVSARHVHLSQAHLEALYGPGYVLTSRFTLGHSGQHACKEWVRLIGVKGCIDRVCVFGPVRDRTQVEISRTDAFQLGVDAPVRMSGDLAGTPCLTLEGPSGERVRLTSGVIRSHRHIRMTPEDALRFGVCAGDTVCVQVGSRPRVILGDVVVRIGPGYTLEILLDRDEANAAGISASDVGYLCQLCPIQA